MEKTWFLKNFQHIGLRLHYVENSSKIMNSWGAGFVYRLVPCYPHHECRMKICPYNRAYILSLHPLYHGSCTLRFPTCEWRGWSPFSHTERTARVGASRLRVRVRLVAERDSVKGFLASVGKDTLRLYRVGRVSVSVREGYRAMTVVNIAFLRA